MTTSNETAACCAQFYEQDWVQTILGDSFHPGGVELTKRLINSLNIKEGDSVLDVACGMGTTSLLIDEQFDTQVTGVDFSAHNVQRAQEIASSKDASVEFKIGDAAELPIEDASIDSLICECAVSTFADQPAALNDFYRVLKSGGNLAISDMVLNGELSQKMQTLLAPWTCLASAKTAAGYQRLLLDAGFVVTSYSDESQALLDLVLDLKKKLLVAGLGKTLATADGVPNVLASLDIAELKSLMDESKQLVNDGVVSYCRMTFAKDRPRMAEKPKLALVDVNNEQCGPGCDC